VPSKDTHVTKVSYSYRFQSEPYEAFMTPEELHELAQDTGHEGLADNLPEGRRIRIVVDGYHVRKALDRHVCDNGKQEEPHDLADWLNRLGDWLSEQYMTNEGIEVYVRAWDAHLPDDEEKKNKAFAALSETVRTRYLNGRGQNYEKQHTVWVTADWHFTDLRRIGDRYVQSGVDARIAADVIAMALERPDLLFLVTGDEDFQRAIEVIKDIEGAPVPMLLTLQPGKSAEGLLAGVAAHRWLVYPEYSGPGFAKSL